MNYMSQQLEMKLGSYNRRESGFPPPCTHVRPESVRGEGPEQRRLDAGATDHPGEQVQVKAIFGILDLSVLNLQLSKNDALRVFVF